MSSTRLSRDEIKKKKAIEEARQAGTLPPEVDNEGNMINPHIPAFMSKAPWYLNPEEGSGLQHQRTNKKAPVLAGMSSWYKRGKDVFVGRAAKGFRKGACRNCGAMSHKAKDCLERPRAVGAWKSGADISRDEAKQEQLKLSYDGSRDRWNGYDASEQLKAIELYNKAEEERRKKALRERDETYKKKKEAKQKRKEERKKKKEQEEAKAGNESSEFDDSSSDEEEDEDGEKEGDGAKLHQKMFTVGTAVKATVRNLRIREDTAKYLRNLDPNSAYYDPKSRSMRENPTPNVPLEELTYAGDNYVSMTGDAVDMAKAQVFSWDAQKLGKTEGHLQSNPTQMMLERKKFAERKEKLKGMKKNAVLAKYGGEDFMKKPDASILNRDTDKYVEYSRDGRVLKGEDKEALVLSKYEEDVFPGNHKSVWGSYFDTDTMSWGFACCWQTTKNGYCTGESGKAAKVKSTNMNLEMAKLPPKLQAAEGKKAQSYEPLEKSRLYGEGSAKVDLDPEKLRKAMDKASAQDREQDGKRKYNSAGDEHNVTAEDMEVYRLKKVKTSDPMSQMQGLGGDLVLPRDARAP